MKKRKQEKIRLSGSNLLKVLNKLLTYCNHYLPEEKRLQEVETPRNLYELRQNINELSLRERGDIAEESNVRREIEVVSQSSLQALTVIATNVWRARKKMLDDESGEPKEEMKRVFRHVAAAFDGLNAIGMEVRDMQGRPYDSGMALKVVSFEPTPRISREMITETIKPTITWNGQLIQMGEVIVGTPQT